MNSTQNHSSHEAVSELTSDEIQDLDSEINQALSDDDIEVECAIRNAKLRAGFAQQWRELKLQRATALKLTDYLDDEMEKYYDIETNY